MKALLLGVSLALVALGAWWFFARERNVLPFAARATLRLQPDTRRPLGVDGVVATLRSEAFLKYVAESFTPKELAHLRTVQPELFEGDRLVPARLSRIVRSEPGKEALDVFITGRSSSADLAAFIADKFSRNFIDYQLDEQMTATQPASREAVRNARPNEYVIGYGLQNVGVRILNRAEPLRSP